MLSDPDRSGARSSDVPDATTSAMLTDYDDRA
jgi:hypothetical protein